MQPTRLADPFVRNVIGQYQTKSAVPMPSRSVTRFVVVHHAAFEYAPGDACRSIFAFHSGKWKDYGRIGYHEVLQIEPDGSLRCYLVNPAAQQGAGVAERNHECFHICAATNFADTVPLQVWIDAYALRIADALARYPGAQIVGHTEVALPGFTTACPGLKWFGWKPALLARVAAIQAANAPKPATYKLRGLPIYQRQDRTGKVAGYLAPDEPVAVDRTYPDGGAHLASGAGFVDLNGLEPA